MHASVVMPLLESVEVSAETKQRLAELVVRERKLIAGKFSEPDTRSLIGERPLKARARRADGGYRITGRKMFASMLEAADFVLVMAAPEDATSPSAGIILMLPRKAKGRICRPELGCPRHARYPRRLVDPRRVLASRKRRRLSLGRCAAVPP
jgi:alkylation response protein AidB-like acyl-CoA dehydrogenase